MIDLRLGFAALAAAGLVAVLMPSPAMAQDGRGFFHHGKRVQSAYCLPRNYWWFYRPYTTKQEDFPRCEPYYHYLEPTAGRRGAPPPYFK
jgi:hypothetical protein